MIGRGQIQRAAADAGSDYASAAGVDADALVDEAIKTMSDGRFAQQLLVRRIAEGASFEAALVSLCAGAWCQGFAAGVLAARVEGVES